MSIWYNGTDLHMFKGDTGNIVFSGLPTDNTYKAYFSVKSMTSSDILFEIVSDVQSLWFDTDGFIIHKNPNETDEEFKERMNELSSLNPPQAFYIGCAGMHISALLSNKLNVKDNEIKHEYYWGLKICNTDGDIQNTLIPKVKVDESGEPIFSDPPKIVVRPKYVQGLYNCRTKYDTEPDIVYVPVDYELLKTVNVNVDSALEISDYGKLYNKPSINGVELSGNKTAIELGLVEIGELKDYVSINEMDEEFTDDEKQQARKNIGVDGLYGTSDPTINTKAYYLGQIYTNTTTKDIFYCYQIQDNLYFWEKFIRRKVFKQIEPSDHWIINHNMNDYPTITITKNAISENMENTNEQDLYFGDITYIDKNTVSIKFDELFSGYAYLL